MKIQRISKKLPSDWVSDLFFSEVYSVRKTGFLLFQTFNTQNNNQLIWSDQYDKKLADIFQVQSEIAKQVASALQTIIPKNEKERIEKVPTTNQKAHAYYLMGRYLLNKRAAKEDDTLEIFKSF